MFYGIIGPKHTLNSPADYINKKITISNKFKLKKRFYKFLGRLYKYLCPRMVCGGKFYQHIIYTLYPNILFSKSSLQEAFPTIKSQFSAKPFFSLADLFNYHCIERLQKELVFNKSVLSLELL